MIKLISQKNRALRKWRKVDEHKETEGGYSSRVDTSRHREGGERGSNVGLNSVYDKKLFFFLPSLRTFSAALPPSPPINTFSHLRTYTLLSHCSFFPPSTAFSHAPLRLSPFPYFLTLTIFCLQSDFLRLFLVHCLCLSLFHSLKLSSLLLLHRIRRFLLQQIT